MILRTRIKVMMTAKLIIPKIWNHKTYIKLVE